MFRCHLVHGIRTRVNDPMVKELIPYLAAVGATVFYPDYGYESGFETRHVNPFIVDAILPYVQPGDLYIGHSNGCAIGYDLANRGAHFGGMIFINAALEAHIVRPAHIPWIDIYYNDGDTITEAAAIAEHLGIADAVWGEMGHAGYIGNDPNITSFNCGSTGDMPVVSGHSDLFTASKVTAWAPYIIHNALARLATPAGP